MSHHPKKTAKIQQEQHYEEKIIWQKETNSLQTFNLRTLILSSNRFKGTIPDGLQNLEYLVLGDNQLTGTIPQEIFQSRRSVILFSNELSGYLPYFEVSEQSKFSTLMIHNNRLR